MNYGLIKKLDTCIFNKLIHRAYEKIKEEKKEGKHNTKKIDGSFFLLSLSLLR